MTTAVDVRGQADAFVDKWRARWPEWALAQVFVPQARREAWVPWFALADELVDAAWAHADPRPGEAKLAWWMQELQGWSTGARRHPLGRALPLGIPAWASLAATLPALGSARDGAMAAPLAAGLHPVARALAEVDAALLEGLHPPADAAAQWSAWLVARRASGPGEDATAMRALALAAWPQVQGDARAPAVWRSILRERLRAGDALRPLPPWRALHGAWRAARNAPVH